MYDLLTPRWGLWLMDGPGILEHCAGRCCGGEGWWREGQVRDGGQLSHLLRIVVYGTNGVCRSFEETPW